MPQSKSDAARLALRGLMVLGRGVAMYLSVGTVTMAAGLFGISWSPLHSGDAFRLPAQAR
jgi:hypothetical protein